MRGGHRLSSRRLPELRLQFESTAVRSLAAAVTAFAKR